MERSGGREPRRGRLPAALAVSLVLHALLLLAIVRVGRHLVVERSPSPPDSVLVVLEEKPSAPEPEIEPPPSPPPALEPTTPRSPRKAAPPPAPGAPEPPPAERREAVTLRALAPRSTALVGALRDGRFVTDSTWAPHVDPLEIALATTTRELNASFRAMLPEVYAEMWWEKFMQTPFYRR